ncbi:MAG TPA: FAD-dependent oxidoreductase, partial [Vicinamibacteria bacterium]
APSGQHTLWAYCHVPAGSRLDRSEAILGQLERFAPGVRARVLAAHATTTLQLEAYNANCVGGDINGGSQHFAQLFARPLLRRVPYSTPRRGLYLCSSSTPPGGGVHGMCGFQAAQAALLRALE